MKFEIKHRYSGELLFSLETESFRLCVEAAIKAKCDLRYSDLSGSNLSYSDLRGSNLSYSDLSYSDLSGSNLSYSDLSGSDLSYSDLRGSDLRYSDLSGSNLRYSDLSYSNLRGSNLRGSDLRGSDLRYSDLRGSDLSYSDLRGSNLSVAKGVTPKVLQIIGSRHPLTVRDYGMVTIGCHHKELSWWEEHYKGVGEKEGYSEAEISEYARHIKAAREFMEQYGLLEKPVVEG